MSVLLFMQRQYAQISSIPLIHEHLASAHRYVSEWTPEKFMSRLAAIHEDVAQYITKVIQCKQHPEQAYKSCSGILSLARKVGNERLIRCLQTGQIVMEYITIPSL